MSQNHTHPPDPAEPHKEPQFGSRPYQRRRKLPAYKLILLADGKNDLMFIIRTVMELTRFCRTEATHKMWQAHYYGQAVLLTTYRERAELFMELFADRGMNVTLEPA
jgi:ATP-dependent Clp protease adapter protein ClpS